LINQRGTIAEAEVVSGKQFFGYLLDCG